MIVEQVGKMGNIKIIIQDWVWGYFGIISIKWGKDLTGFLKRPG